PEQREALLERRAAEDELRQSQRELAPLDLAQHLHALTAAALQREQDEQAARMAEARAYCQQALSEFRAELAQKAEQERALEAEREHRQRLEAERERERPQRPEPEQAPLLEPLPAIGIGSPAFVERLQAALAQTMEQLQAQREQSPAQEPPPQRSRGFDMEP
ncbi:MAG TPA: hypothetical protein PK777_07970, partial [Thermoguttaceae bacterium]|nr:hypothetical protein [Thermoguttaceae bacterium]